MSNENETGPRLIHGYSRQEAIKDGLLIDMTPIASEHGIAVPVAYSQAVQVELRLALEPLQVPMTEAEVGAAIAIGFKEAVTLLKPQTGVMFFSVAKAAKSWKGKTWSSPRLLKAEIGSDDDGSPCITIFLRDETD